MHFRIRTIPLSPLLSCTRIYGNWLRTNCNELRTFFPANSVHHLLLTFNYHQYHQYFNFHFSLKKTILQEKKECKYDSKNMTFRRCHPAIIECAEFKMYRPHVAGYFGNAETFFSEHGYRPHVSGVFDHQIRSPGWRVL